MVLCLVSFMVASFNINDYSGCRQSFKCWKTHPYVNHIVGFDSNRLCEYEMWYCDSFPFPGVSKLMNVAHVKESYVKSKRQEDFWYAQMKALLGSNCES